MYSNSNYLDDLALIISTANSPLSSEVEKQGVRRHRSTPPGQGEEALHQLSGQRGPSQAFHSPLSQFSSRLTPSEDKNQSSGYYCPLQDGNLLQYPTSSRYAGKSQNPRCLNHVLNTEHLQVGTYNRNKHNVEMDKPGNEGPEISSDVGLPAQSNTNAWQ